MLGRRMMTSPPQHAGPGIKLTADLPISSIVSPDPANSTSPYRIGV